MEPSGHGAYNNVGQLGDGTNLSRFTPVQVPNLNDVVSVAAGMWHSLALKDDGTVWSWGFNGSGQLGRGTPASLYVDYNAGMVTNLVNVDSISSGAEHSLGIAAGGTVWTWGQNGAGQLGDGTTSWRSNPGLVRIGPAPLLLSHISGGDYFTVGAGMDGSVWGWGANGSGQLGDGTTSNRSTPGQVASGIFRGIAKVSAGSTHAVALKFDGTIWAWGGNSSGQLGDGSTSDRSLPGLVGNFNNASAVDAGGSLSLAIAGESRLPFPSAPDPLPIQVPGPRPSDACNNGIKIVEATDPAYIKLYVNNSDDSRVIVCFRVGGVNHALGGNVTASGPEPFEIEIIPEDVCDIATAHQSVIGQTVKLTFEPSHSAVCIRANGQWTSLLVPAGPQSPISIQFDN